MELCHRPATTWLADTAGVLQCLLPVLVPTSSQQQLSVCVVVVVVVVLIQMYMREEGTDVGRPGAVPILTLQDGLTRGLDRLAAAGIRTSVTLNRNRERQGSRDRLTMVLPMRLREGGSMGADKMPDGDGRFGVSDFNESVFD